MNRFESIWIADRRGRRSQMRGLPDHHPTRDRLGGKVWWKGEHEVINTHTDASRIIWDSVAALDQGILILRNLL